MSIPHAKIAESLENRASMKMRRRCLSEAYGLAEQAIEAMQSVWTEGTPPDAKAAWKLAKLHLRASHCCWSKFYARSTARGSRWEWRRQGGSHDLQAANIFSTGWKLPGHLGIYDLIPGWYHIDLVARKFSALDFRGELDESLSEAQRYAEKAVAIAEFLAERGQNYAVLLHQTKLTLSEILFRQKSFQQALQLVDEVIAFRQDFIARKRSQKKEIPASSWLDDAIELRNKIRYEIEHPVPMSVQILGGEQGVLRFNESRGRLMNLLVEIFPDWSDKIRTRLSISSDKKAGIMVVILATKNETRKECIDSVTFAQIKSRMPGDFEGYALGVSFTTPVRGSFRAA